MKLLLRPHDREEFVADRSFRARAVEEMLRYESPLQFVERRAACDSVLGGVVIPRNASVRLLLGSANHDEREFTDPDEFRAQRSPNPHLAFGYGTHLCLGAPLARIEIPMALETTLRRFPGLRLACAASELRWRENFMFHALEVLPVAYG